MFKIGVERTRTNFQISVGEEGAVVVYARDGIAQNRLFVKTTDKQDVQKLVQLLEADPIATISLYLDTLDQSFVQKTLPGVNALSVNTIAQSRLEKEIPKTYLKTYAQVMRHTTGRRDWVYTFVAASYDPPISKWVSFLLPYPNIIEGIYFLPVELSAILPKLRNKTSKPIANIVGFEAIKSLFSSGSTDGARTVGWEILICQNKTGGFRQVAFLNGKIIFSRLLNNVMDPDEDVLAGNIEQEIANSTEYLSRLALGMEDSISVYVILPEEVLKFIRSDKIKATTVKLFTAQQAAERLGLRNVATNKDKFFDPVFLNYMAANQLNVGRVHCDETKVVYRAAVGIKFAKKILGIIMPVLAFAILYNVYTFLSVQLSVGSLKDQIHSIESKIAEGKAAVDGLSAKANNNLPVKQLNEIVSLHQFMTQTNETPISIAMKLSSAMPEYARVKSIGWNYYDAGLMNFIPSKTNPVFTNPDAIRPYAVEIELDVLFIEVGDTYQELADRYHSFVSSIRKAFEGMHVDISELPSSFNFEAKNVKLSFKVNVKYPLDSKVVPTPQMRAGQR